jgi:hypothetical protein
MEDTLAHALQGACANLNRTAARLGAVSAAVLRNAEWGTEIAHFWSATSATSPARGGEAAGTIRNQSLSRAEGAGEATDAGSLPANLLLEVIGPGSHSFLVHRWETNRRAIAIVLGFADPEPPLQRLPDAVEATLDLIALAFWSAREITRLRAELKEADRRLASRKLVERAKGVLQLERGISEESAYAYLRGQSRRRRVTLARIAEEVVRVNGGFDRSHIS